ncbi:type IV secretory system conjugative DNA transfer family protein [Marinicella sp. W31]|uniref:type IV secretory system conjugative DNA transfer family protein n=1 Tax=Marinicella sp. W31 TaxID=3023713 RepID=UPI0037566185
MSQKKVFYIVLGTMLLLSSIVVWYVLMLSIAKIPGGYWFDFSFIDYLSSGQLDLKKPALISLSIVCGFLALIIILIVAPKNRLFGNARWANWLEIMSYGYLEKKGGLILGQAKGRLLRSIGPKHLSLSAEPRSGKTVSCVIPNLLSWNKSSVAVDIKGELTEITSGYRSQFQDVYLFNPLGEKNDSHCINVFDHLAKDEYEALTQIQTIAHQFIPDVSGKEGIWFSGARNIFIGTALFLRETGQHLSFGSIYQWVNEGDCRYRMYCALLQFSELSKPCKTAFKKHINAEPTKVAPGFLSEFNTRMEPFSNPKIAAATDKSDFDFKDLRTGNMSVYLICMPNHIGVLGRLLGIIIEQMLYAITSRIPTKDEKGSVLFMLDEFTALGKLNQVRKGAAFLGGYGIRMAMIFQNQHQVFSTYGRDEGNELLALAQERIVFATSEQDDAEKYSRELGNLTVKRSSRSYSGGHLSRSISDAGKPLMTPDEIRRLSKKKQIIFGTNQRPIKCKKIIYYKDRRFKHKLLAPFNGIPQLYFMEYDFIELDEPKKADQKTIDLEKALENLDDDIL